MSFINKPISGSKQDLINRRDELIRSEENFILRTASITSKRFVTKSDDEWSVALMAFSEAIDTYDEKRGDFRAYAKVLIQRSLIDYFRTQTKYSNEIAISFDNLENKSNTNNSNPKVDASPAMELLQVEDRSSLQEEILAITGELKNFGISFMELAECSPKQARSREDCKRAVNCLLANEDLLIRLMNTKQLPIAEIVKREKISKKSLDRYRKYIIMSVIVLSNEYPGISEYLSFMKGDQKIEGSNS